MAKQPLEDEDTGEDEEEDLFADMPDEGDELDEDMPEGEDDLPLDDDGLDEEMPEDEGLDEDFGDDELDDLPPEDELGDMDLDDEGLDDMDDVAGESGMMAKLGELSGLLDRMDVVVSPEDAATPEEFVSHLCTALKTHLKTRGDEAGDYPGDDEGDNAPAAQEEPQMITMSQRRQNSRMVAMQDRLVGLMTREIDGKIGALVRNGQTTPHQARQWQELLRHRKVRLSMVESRPDSTLAAVLAQIKFAQSVPKGTYWDRKQRAAYREEAEEVRLSLKAQRGDAGPRTREEAADTIAHLARLAGGPASLFEGNGKKK